MMAWAKAMLMTTQTQMVIIAKTIFTSCTLLYNYFYSHVYSPVLQFNNYFKVSYHLKSRLSMGKTIIDAHNTIVRI